MKKKVLKFSRVRVVKAPMYGTKGSAGIDFFVPNDFKPFILKPGCDVLIPSGVKVNIPSGYMLLGADKSGITTSIPACERIGRRPTIFESSVIVGAKVIDEDYQGELHIHLINVGNADVTIKPGMKIAQFILVPLLYAELEEVLGTGELFSSVSERAEGGFGSTN